VLELAVDHLEDRGDGALVLDRKSVV